MGVEKTGEKEKQRGDVDAGRVPWCGHVATTYTLGACVLGGHHDADQSIKPFPRLLLSSE